MHCLNHQMRMISMSDCLLLTAHVENPKAVRNQRRVGEVSPADLTRSNKSPDDIVVGNT